MKSPPSSQKLFDNYASGYEKKFNESPLGKYQRERIHREMTPFFGKAKTLLDVGCGPGSDFAFYQKMNLRVEALDISKEMVKIARQKSSLYNLNAKVHHCGLLEFETSSRYDMIILNFGVINTFADISPALDKLKTLLKPNGVCMIVTMPPFHFFSLAALLVKFKLRAFANRIFQKQAVLADGFRISYYSKNDFLRHFTCIKHIALCWCLPTPDQYQQRKWARFITKAFLKIDRKFADKIPAFLGGDHLCLILKASKS